MREESCDGNEEGSENKNSILATLILRQSLVISLQLSGKYLDI